MTDIVERLRAFAPTVAARSRVPLAAAAIINATDEIDRLRKEKQELELQYLSDQGQWIEETGRLRGALRHYVSECDCNGGTFHQEDHITGKTLIKDCPKCEPARAALGEKE